MNNEYETIDLDEITDKELKDWKSLPESIKDDVCFEAYQKESSKSFYGK